MRIKAKVIPPANMEAVKGLNLISPARMGVVNELN